jgi:hypothetical protein
VIRCTGLAVIFVRLLRYNIGSGHSPPRREPSKRLADPAATLTW